MRQLIRTKYPAFLSLWTGCRHWIQQIDIARLFILHEYGGIYCDLDIIPKCTVPVMINEGS